MPKHESLSMGSRFQGCLAHDPTLTLQDVLFLIARGASANDHTQPQFSLFMYDLKGFANTENQQHWTNMLNWVQHQFDPTVLLVRRINSEPPPKGKPQKLWVQCIKALVHLQQQSLIQREDCTYVSDLLFVFTSSQCLLSVYRFYSSGFLLA